MKRRHVLAICGASVGLFTGCSVVAPDAEEDDDTLLSNETGTSSQAAASTDSDSEKNATPHEFVHVEPVENQSEVAAVPTNDTVAFSDLSDQRRRTFRDALDQDTVAAGEWSYFNESRPKYVRYNGTWFRVVVGVH